LNGTWHTDGTGPDGADGESQSDPYTVSVSGGEAKDADFGYYVEAAALGDFVWWDVDGDGEQDGDPLNDGEPGIPGAVVTLTITYPNGDVITLTTTTDGYGRYSFDNLLADESYDGVETGEVGDTEPLYVLSAPKPTGYLLVSPANPSGVPDDDDSDDSVNGEPATVTQGSTNDTYDFGFDNDPTSVMMGSFLATEQANHILVSWHTVIETDLSGFNLYRAETPGGPWVQLNAELIEAEVPGSPYGATYRWEDWAVEQCGTYFYEIEAVHTTGVVRYGPISVMAPCSGFTTYLPLVVR
jgi:hypothetical protein